jgi:predicted alpha/beta superfamily hydrolase
MKTFRLTTFIGVFLLFCFGGIQGQQVTPKSKNFPPDIIVDTLLQAQTIQTKPSPVCLENTEQFPITSNYVKDENFVIQVGLPMSYATSGKSYPVLYVLDGDYTFAVTKQIADFLMLGKEIKEIIVIGISYGQGMGAWWYKRGRDLTPGTDTVYAKGVNAGGADNFIRFIQEELFPAVNKNYRTNPDSLAIIGASLGGLLDSYVLVTQPELFKGYIIVAPSLGWNNKIVLKKEAEYFRNHKELNAAVYMAYGSMDSLNNKDYTINPTNELFQIMQSHNYKGMRLVKRIFEGETHYSVFSTAFINGVKTLFMP